MKLINHTVHVFENPEDLAQNAASEFVELANEAVEAQGFFTVALSGGSTPKQLYTLLATPAYRDLVPWQNVHLFWGDERFVPTDHPDSNYRMVRERLLEQVSLSPTNVHPVPIHETDPAQTASEYEQELRQFFELTGNELPRFDLVLLGMGPDGHTASLFPGTNVVHEQTRLVAAPWVEKFKTYRITLTPPVLNHAASVIFFVTGDEKAETLRTVLEGEYQPDRYPAQIIHPTEGRLLWMVDRAAASLLETQ